MLNRAVVLSALSISQTKRGWWCRQRQHTAALIHAVMQHKPQLQSETQALRPEQLLLPTANSLFFLLTFLLCSAHSHTNGSAPSFSFYSFPCFFFSLLHLFIFFSILPHYHSSAQIAPQPGNVPPIRPSHLLIISLISLNCYWLTNNDPRPVYLQYQGSVMLLFHRQNTLLLGLSTSVDDRGGLWIFGLGQRMAKWLWEPPVIPLFGMGPAGAQWKM